MIQRERGAVSVIEDDRLKKEIKNLGNLNHAILKFFKGFAYVVSRDGFISRIDTSKDVLLKKTKVGDSAIGFTFCNRKVVVANYAPHDVVFLSEDLQIIRRIFTDSRNVGIKNYRDLVVFSLMDRDDIWVVDCEGGKIVKVFRDVGDMPFDALLTKKIYVVGFFKENAVGVIDLQRMKFRKVRFGKDGKEVVLKIPHFGTWGIYQNTAYIPGVGERKIHVVDLNSFQYIGSIDVPGLPVFVSVSPDGRYIAVNFSGDKEDYLTLIDRKKGKVLKTSQLGRRILHFRFTPDGRYIYLSSYYENRLKKVSVPDLRVVNEIGVPTPSGVFIKGG